MGYLYAGIGVVILILSVTCYIFYQKSVIAEKDLAAIVLELDKAKAANVASEKTLEDIQKRIEASRIATEKEIAASRTRAADIDEIKKGNGNDPQANDPAGAFFDNLGKRLRKENSGN